MRNECQDILMMAKGFCASRLILTAAELEIFTKLPATAKEIILDNPWDLNALIILLDALTAIQLIEKKDDVYSVPKRLKKALSAEAEESIIPMIEHLNSMWHNWSYLSDIIKNNKGNNHKVLKDEKTLQSFIMAMHVIGRDVADNLTTMLDPSWAKNILDVGGASGTYTIAFLNAAKGARATLFDLPPVISLACERLKGSELLKRITFKAGDFYKNTLPAGHDLVWLSAIIHQNSREQNRMLFKKCFNALINKGKIWIRDHIMDETRTNPPSGAIFAVNMLVMTPHGGTYTLDEVSEDLIYAGFINPEMIHKSDEMDCVVEAVKP